ncbi:HNH endonuclease [Carnobacterium maltaromaticum]|uniref:HNH endonuclease n=1 Tax=Carnobacterium maltaromaticum TaxID=2751 RepID=UPI0039B11BF9
MEKVKKGRKSKYDTHVAPRLQEIEWWCREGLTEIEICKRLDVAESTFNNYKREFSELMESLKKGKEIADYQVEDALFKRAVGYEYTEITRERIVDTGQKKRHGGESELTTEEWEMAQRYFKGECAYCGSSDKITKDHLDPLKNGGKLIESNVVPACGNCNSSKRDYQWLSWYQKQPFYSKEKGQKILDYVDFVLSMPVSDKDSEMIVTKEVVKQVSPDTGAIALWLKNRKRDSWQKHNSIDEEFKKEQIKLAKAQTKSIENMLDEESSDTENITIVDSWGGGVSE